jgi:hypothetical protein
MKTPHLTREKKTFEGLINTVQYDITMSNGFGFKSFSIPVVQIIYLPHQINHNEAL